MIGNVIQEYLVSLGFHVDKPGFDAMNQTIKTTTSVVEQATGSWAKSFLAASGIVTTSLASITTALIGVTKAAATEDLQMQKLGRNMMIGKDAAWSLKKATDALGESMTDIMLTPELNERFHKLVEDGNNMKVSGDFAETMRGFRDLMFQFTRLKQEVSYAMTWVGYYITKYLSRPLAEAEAKFRNFNDKFVANMSVWTEKAARAAVYIINIGLHFIEFLARVKRGLGEMWDSFPKGVKVAIAAVAALSAVIKASPLGRLIQIISVLLLLIDDYFGYFEGKDALLGKYWDKLNRILEQVAKWMEKGTQAAEEFGNDLMDISERITSSDAFQNLAGAVIQLAMALKDLADNVIRTAVGMLQDFIKASEKYGLVDAFKESVKALSKALTVVINVIEKAVRWINELLQRLDDSGALTEFIDSLAEFVSVTNELIAAIWSLVADALRAFFGSLEKTGTVNEFTDALKILLKIATFLVRTFSNMVKVFKRLLDHMRSNRKFVAFWEGIGRAISTFSNIFNRVIDKAIEKTGKFGRALARLIKGDFKGAVDAITGGKGNSGKGNFEWNKKVVYNRFKEAGYSDEAIAGIMGRLQQEHGFDTSDAPEHYVDGIGMVGGYGMFQWTESSGRKGAFLNWCKMNGRDPQDPGTQADYAIIEAMQKGMSPDVMNSMTYDEAARAWTRDWEVGAPGNEVEYAQGYLQRIRNGDFSSSNGSYPTGADGEPLLPEGLKVWHSEGGTTDVNGFQPGMTTFLNELADAAKEAGVTFTITGGTEAGHAEGEFSHANGYKVDIDDSLTSEQKAILRQVLAKFAHDINHENGHYDITIRNDDQWSLGDYASYGIGKIRGAIGGNNLVDPTLMRGFIGPSSSLMPAGVSTAGTTIIQNTVSVGGVNVAGTNASADEIGTAVGQKTIEALTRRGQYLVRNRAMTGGPILT